MFRSRTITISILCPWQQVYEFLAEPLNLPTWGSNTGSSIEHVTGNDWASADEGGRTIYRYHPRNEYGILDHAVFREGETPHTIPMRIVANGEDGAELIYTLFQRPQMSEEAFTSEAEWVEADFLALKSLLESRRGAR